MATYYFKKLKIIVNMKSTINVNFRMLAMSLLAVFMLSLTSFAANENKEKANSKTFAKAKAAVEAAAADDWETLAKSAKKLLKKNTNLDEASAWIDQSIAIEANATNLALKGDYYKLVGDNKQAKAYYIKAMAAAKAKSHNASLTALQNKVASVM